MTVRIVQTIDEGLWQEFVDSHPQGNVFHTPQMYRVFAGSHGHLPSLWAALGTSGQILALFVPVEVTINPFLRKLTTRAVAYGSVLFELSCQGKEALELLLRTYARHVGSGVLFTELRNLSDLSEAQPVLAACGFEFEKHLNYVIDLDRPVELIFKNIGPRTRKNIRKGLNRGDVIIEEVTQREDVKHCYGLLKRTYAAAKVPLADLSLFESAFDQLYPKNMIRFFKASVGDALVSVSVELLYKSTIYGWYGGVEREYRSFIPNELLTWHILKWGAENDYKTYDFGGAGKPDEPYGVREFKAKFGGKLVSHGRNIRVQNPALLRIGEVGYKIYRRLL